MEKKQQKSIMPQTNKPLIEILGNNRVLIEHHKGICIYERQMMQIRVCYGFIEISGCDLTITCMSKEQLVITGKIDGVRLLRGDKG